MSIWWTKYHAYAIGAWLILVLAIAVYFAATPGTCHIMCFIAPCPQPSSFECFATKHSWVLPLVLISPVLVYLGATLAAKSLQRS